MRPEAIVGGGKVNAGGNLLREKTEKNKAEKSQRKGLKTKFQVKKNNPKRFLWGRKKPPEEVSLS